MATNTHLRDNTRKEDPYIFNNAVLEERKRVDEQSVALNVLMHDHPIHAPLSDPRKILEIGYGTGLMCNYLGGKFQKAMVYGIDPSPPAAGFHDKLQNVEYIQGKYEDLLTDGDPRLELASFDYVFVRMAICWVTDWPAHVRRIKSLLKPGGWVELQDANLGQYWSGTKPSPVDEDWLWARVVRDICFANIDWASGTNLESKMNETGFRDVKSVEYPFAVCYPFSDKPETQMIAEYTAKYVPQVVFGLLDQYARSKYSTDEVQQMKDHAKETAYSGKIKECHFKFYACVGRKAE